MSACRPHRRTVQIEATVVLFEHCAKDGNQRQVPRGRAIVDKTLRTKADFAIFDYMKSLCRLLHVA